jgi:predicted dehydrogenase
VVLTLSHPLDYLMWFFGDVARVWAEAGSISPLGLSVEDYAEIQLGFAGGVRANVHLDYYRRPPAHRLEVACSEGLVVWDNSDGGVRVYHADRGAWQAYAPPDGFERNWLFLDEMRHFLAVCRGELRPLCTLDDGEKALRLALAALESSRQGSAIRLEQP